MRLAVLALTLLPLAAQAQETTAPTLTCPVGTTWDATAGTCAAVTGAASPLDGLKERSGCSHGAAREVTS